MLKRAIEKELVPYCISRQIGILAYSPLERGILTGKIRPGHVFKEGDHRSKLVFYKDENIRRTNAFLDKILPIADARQVTLAQLVLRWTIEQPGITVALVGARNAMQAEQNAGAINCKLTTEELQLISTALSELQLAE
jgi:aryl-alcohol dehydrogenase-like predicted oxidoreductase